MVRSLPLDGSPMQQFVVSELTRPRMWKLWVAPPFASQWSPPKDHSPGVGATYYWHINGDWRAHSPGVGAHYDLHIDGELTHQDENFRKKTYRQKFLSLKSVKYPYRHTLKVWNQYLENWLRNSEKIIF